MCSSVRGVFRDVFQCSWYVFASAWCCYLWCYYRYYRYYLLTILPTPSSSISLCTMPLIHSLSTYLPLQLEAPGTKLGHARRYAMFCDGFVTGCVILCSSSGTTRARKPRRWRVTGVTPVLLKWLELLRAVTAVLLASYRCDTGVAEVARAVTGSYSCVAGELPV